VPGRPGRSRSPSAGYSALSALRSIGRDRRTGAHGLSTATLEILSRAVDAWRNDPPTHPARVVRSVARSLDRIQPAMGTFRRWAIEWTRIASEVPERRLLGTLVRWTRGWRVRLAREPRRLETVARERLPRHGRVLTLSRSESVRRALAAGRGARRPSEVIVLESRPGGEGRTFARELRGQGLPARVVADREGLRLVDHVDLLLIGADAVYEDGSVVHKVGTRRLALAAHRLGVPVVVVTGRSKAVPRTRPARPLPRRFDRTPGRAIREYWTDRGREVARSWRPRSLRRR